MRNVQSRGEAECDTGWSFARLDRFDRRRSVSRCWDHGIKLVGVCDDCFDLATVRGTVFKKMLS